MKGDMISRQAAVSGISDLLMLELKGERLPTYNEVYRAIYNLPSAQPERKKGKWEIYVISMLDGEGCRCSECGFEGAPSWDYCPHCGSDMREENDG